MKAGMQNGMHRVSLIYKQPVKVMSSPKAAVAAVLEHVIACGSLYETQADAYGCSRMV